jgi:hypothetical protein
MKRVLILLHIILCTCIVTQAKNYTVSSPDGKTKVTVTAGKQLSWSINYNGERILNPSLMQMDIEGQTEQPGVNPKVIKAKTLKVNSEQTAVIPLKQRIIKDQYNQLTLTCKGNYAIVFRVYNNGAAYRFETSLKQPKVIINTETIEQNWTEGCKLYWPREKNQEYLTHCEAIFDELNISSLTNDMKGYLPIYLSTPKGTKVVIMESDLFDYPNLFLTGDRNNTLSGEFPPVVLKSALKEGTDRDEVLLEKASYIAETEGTRAFPWRVLMINEDDKAVIENNLVYQLASPSVTQDTEWIKPGKISWDWWSTLNVYGVDFKAGVNTDTYKYFIDFASKYGIEYILLDMSPSISSTNANILMESDYFIIPCAPDYFCYMAIESLTKVFPRWNTTYQKLRENDIFKSATYKMKATSPKFIGTIQQRYRPRNGSPVKAFSEWITDINQLVSNKLVPVLQKNNMIAPNLSDYCTENYNLINIADFNSLIAQSQLHNTPVFLLTQEQIEKSGKVWTNMKKNRDDFNNTFTDFANRIIRVTN